MVWPGGNQDADIGGAVPDSDPPVGRGRAAAVDAVSVFPALGHFYSVSPTAGRRDEQTAAAACFHGTFSAATAFCSARWRIMVAFPRCQNQPVALKYKYKNTPAMLVSLILFRTVPLHEGILYQVVDGMPARTGRQKQPCGYPPASAGS